MSPRSQPKSWGLLGSDPEYLQLWQERPEETSIAGSGFVLLAGAMAIVPPPPTVRVKSPESQLRKSLRLGLLAGGAVGALVGACGMLIVIFAPRVLGEPVMDGNDDFEGLLVLPFVVLFGAAVGAVLGLIVGPMLGLTGREGSAPAAAAVLAGTVTLVGAVIILRDEVLIGPAELFSPTSR